MDAWARVLSHLTWAFGSVLISVVPMVGVSISRSLWCSVRSSWPTLLIIGCRVLLLRLSPLPLVGFFVDRSSCSSWLLLV